MDTAEKQQVVPTASLHGEVVGVDTVADGSEVVERGMAVGVADGDVAGGGVVFLEDRKDGRRREPVDGREHRGVYQTGIGQWQEVEAVADDVELGGSLEHIGYVQVFRDLWFGVAVF